MLSCSLMEYRSLFHIIPCQIKRRCRHVFNQIRKQTTDSLIGPTAVYNKLVESGKILEDSYQRRALTGLERIYEELQSYTVSKPSKGFSLFSSSVKPNAPKGLYIYGSVGGGKTMMMDLFFECVQTTPKQRVHFNAFMLKIHSSIHQHKQTNPHKIDRDLKNAFNPMPSIAKAIFEESCLLCFDEFQVTDIGDAMILKTLFTELFSIGCVVVATSNRPPDDLYKNGLQRSNFVPFIQILKDNCEIMSVNSDKDYRRITAESNKNSTYFLITEDTTDDPVDKIFKHLISMENDTVRARTINILGRNVEFSKACGQVLDSNFYELCERPLGASDYLILAKTFHTVIIRNVPQMNAKSSSVRRFITLIDNFYDNGIKLIISAKVSVTDLFIVTDTGGNEDANRMLMDDLKIEKGSENASASIFTGEEEVFAFERCVSRIIEMQTEEYWGRANKS